MAPNRVYYSHSGSLEETASWFSSNTEYTGHCSVGDIDDDGYPDFAVADFIGYDGFSTGNRSHVYMNNGGILSTTPDWTTDDSIYTFSCAFGDADGDGDLDLAFATGESYNGILQNNLIYYNVDGVWQTSPGWQSAAGTAFRKDGHDGYGQSGHFIYIFRDLLGRAGKVAVQEAGDAQQKAG